MMDNNTAAVERTAIYIARVVLNEFIGTKSPSASNHKHEKHEKHEKSDIVRATAMIAATKKMAIKHEILFNGMLDRLDATDDNAGDIFTQISVTMLEDGVINWGRIITVYAFAGCLARRCDERDMYESVADIGDALREFVSSNFVEWIRHRNGGWQEFEAFCDEPDDDTAMFRYLTLATIGWGIVALTTYYLAIR